MSGEELEDLVRRGIKELFAKGAKPVVGAMDGIHVWTTVDYGNNVASVSEAIIEEWRNSRRDPDAGDVWFALPHIFNASRPPDEPHKRKEDLS